MMGAGRQWKYVLKVLNGKDCQPSISYGGPATAAGPCPQSPGPMAQLLPGPSPDPTLWGCALCPLTIPLLGAVHLGLTRLRPGPRGGAPLQTPPPRTGPSRDDTHSSPCSQELPTGGLSGSAAPLSLEAHCSHSGAPADGESHPRLGRPPLLSAGAQERWLGRRALRVLPQLCSCRLGLLRCPVPLA